MGIMMPMTSASWNASFPSWLALTLQVIATTGDESRCAVAMPVVRFVAPGPDVARHTPTLPVDLA